MPNPLQRRLTVFPTYAYQDPTNENLWVFQMRVWVYRHILNVPDRLLRLLVDDAREDELLTLEARLADFVADDDHKAEVTFRFDEDADEETFRFSAKTDDNGLVEEKFRISKKKAERLLGAQRANSKWLKVTAQARGLLGKASASGSVRLIEPQGTSVVSDIDDTIKVSEIPAGGSIVIRNTFIRKFVFVPEMLDLYGAHGDIPFHYVSGSPWQLFGLLHAFLIEESGFPKGTFHMKDLRKNPLDYETFFNDVRNFIAGKAYTQRQKVRQISELMDSLPRRDFILIGDSGELDPETFAEIRSKYGARVKEIIIRKVTGEDESDERFKDMRLLAAPLVVHGQSQFD